MLRAAAYVPRGTDGRRRVRSWDEDAFTLAAAAIELLVAGRGPGPPGWTVRPIGAARDLAAELFAGVLGTAAAVVPSPDRTASPLGDARGRAPHAAGPELLVGVVEDAPPPSKHPAPPPGEGGFALLIDELPSGSASLLPAGTAPPAGHELAELFPLARRSPDNAAAGWVGDWKADPSSGRLPPSRPPAGSPPPTSVSEGAYVPRASYVDAIASRWRFVGERCTSCSKITFPGRGRCRSCGRSDRLLPEALPRERLEVVAVTWIGSGGQPTEFDQQVEASGPYGVAIVQLADGVRATVALTDADAGEVKVGSRVDTTLRRLYAIEGSWRYGRKAVPRRAGRL